jgi:predicted metal-dependent hydrolase
MGGGLPCAPVRRTIEYGDRTIEVELSFSPRKRLSISVHPDLRVTAAAPEDRSEEQVLLRVRKRALWIVRHLRRFEGRPPAQPPRQYVSGETYRYLGRQHRLKVVEGRPEGVKLIGAFLCVTTRDPGDTARVKALLERWYRQHAREVFTRKIREVHERARVHGVPPPAEWALRSMRSRWGTCRQRSGRMTLNAHLVTAPLSCIEYVIAHELCHLKAPNHSSEFYRLLSLVMPDWRERKERLGEIAL